MSEPTWEQWRREVFGDGYQVWHDGPDTTTSTARWLADRARTEQMLLVGLAADDVATAQAVEDFAAAGHTPGPDVVAALNAATGPDRAPAMRVAALRANWIVTRDPAAVSGLVARLLDRRRLVGRSRSVDARRSAAIALRDVPATPEVVAALAGAVAHDGDYGVRYHAASSLLRLAGDDPNRSMTPPMIDVLAARGRPWARAALARDLRARVRTVDGS